MDEQTQTKGGAKAPPPVVEPAGKAADPAAVLGASGNEPLSYGDLEARKRAKRVPPFIAAFLPNRAVSVGAMRVLMLIELGIALAIWITSPFQVLPQPGEVLKALGDLWMNQGLGPELFTSFGLSLEAVALSTFISLVLSYLTVLPVFRPFVAALSKGRFLSLVGFSFVFTLMVGGGRPLKLSLLVFGMSVFFLTSMASVIAQIPKEEFDYARTLRMSEWRVVWEVVVLGTAAQAWEVLRQNAAIGWMMLTMVEGISRSEGGVGAMLLNQSKHFHLAEVFAIQVLILAVGLVQDYGIGVLRRLTCPYADLTLERKDA
jgi:NitT/TauT family transport system permease protein